MANPSEVAGTGGRHVAAVIPCYNAGAHLAPVVSGLCAAVARVIVVDDGCTDGCTGGLPETIEVVRHAENLGKGHAILSGLRAALADPAMEVVCLLDADGQHDPREAPGLVEALRREDADLVIGARSFQQGHVPWRSRFGNTITASVTATLLGRRLPDTQCGFRALSRRFAEAVAAQVKGGRYETEMEMIVFGIRGGFRVSSSPIRTLYEAGNPTSHFRKVRDSARIYARLLRAVLWKSAPRER